jgi:hypothetical protein
LRVRRVGSVEVTRDLEVRAGVIDSLCVNLPEVIVRLHADCIGPDGGFGAQYCPPWKPDSAGRGRPNVRCS